MPRGDDEEAEERIDIICAVAKTGEVGGGKISAVPIEEAVRIRIGEHGGDAL